jgi:predicted ATP-grasp superfamily ATP-dependent carboligase
VSPGVPSRVLVTDAARGSATAIIRSLGRSGWHVVAADPDPLAPGLFSRHVRERARYPDPRRDPDAALAALRRIVSDRRIDVLVPVTDDVIAPLSTARDTFGACVLALPPADALATTADKGATVELARAVGVPTPQTCVVRTVEEAVERASSFRWPIVLKPARSKRYEPGRPLESFAVAYAEDVAQLRAKVEPLQRRSAILMQEYYGGEGHGVGLLFHEGCPLAAFQHRRLREFPLTGGTSSFRESVPLEPALYEFSVRLLQPLRWSGPALVEFKIGERGPKLMEINGRVWGSLPLAVKSGVDFPARWLELYRSGPPHVADPAQTRYAVGVRSRDLAMELAWIGSVLKRTRRYSFERLPRRTAAIRVALSLLSPSGGYDVISPNDPLPGVVEIARAVRVAALQLGAAATDR